MRNRLLAAAAFGLAALLAATSPVAAQQGKDWFIPGQHRREPAHPVARPPAPAHPAVPGGVPGAPGGAEQAKLNLPPAPSVPDVAHGEMPPAAVLGVISIPDVLRESTAYLAADKVLSKRRQDLNEDAQKEQAALRDLSQKLAAERSKLSPAQIRAKEKELQDRIAESRRKFTERNRVIQEQGQYALAQIERTLREVVQKVALSRGMNLVLQRAEVALNLPQFDITSQVTKVLNKALPGVVIPPEGVSPVKLSEAGPAPKEASGHKSRHR